MEFGLQTSLRQLESREVAKEWRSRRLKANLQVQLECEDGRRWMKGGVELGADREVKKLSQNMLVVTSKAPTVNDDATL